jgi:hypothetical protein
MAHLLHHDKAEEKLEKVYRIDDWTACAADDGG